MIERDPRPPRGRHHHTYYFMGRKHVIFRGKTMQSMRVYQWQDSTACHREVFYLF